MLKRSWVNGPLLVAALSCVLTDPVGVRAAVLLALDLPQLVANSDHVVLGTPRARAARRSQDGQYIVTDVELQVQRSLKGDAKVGDTLLVTRLGGVIDDLGLRVPGAATFTLGQRVLVFLRQTPASGELRVVGMSQGVMSLVERDGSTMVLGDSTAALMKPDVQGKLRPAPGAAAAPRSLVELLPEIERLVRGSGER